MRTNLRFIARAIDWPSEVLPTPGGPTKQRIGPFIAPADGARNVVAGAIAGAVLSAVTVSSGALAAAAALPLRRSFCTARYSTIRSLTLSRS